VNVTPTRCRAVTPLIGSLSALPSWIALWAVSGPQRGRHIGDGLRRLVEDVVALADLVPDVGERQEHVLARLDDVAVDAGLALERVARSVTCLA
jgi:hypothetical protein